MNPAAIRPIMPFRVHFDDASITPLDIDACDAEEARKIAKQRRPGKPINKIKIVREKI
ncbi:MAG TPA: hypothetical protein VL202_00345 [Pararhizobium sp.]|uniref:hypothetical protein n=1 Tax=Pararhizobium sp. TaxID=1977563 RepID=UPI002BB80D0E|nr:hypothetical protein [Pararhizobium sp.]HTO29619.1 hypothetical protein [Pararhizobium sp.]